MESTTVTPEMAKQLLEKSPDYQRKIRKSAVATYARMMRNGQWESESVLQTSQGFLVDGHHRLLAVIEAGVPVNFVIVTHNGNDDPMKRYKTIDQNMPRSLRDVSRVEYAQSESDSVMTMTDRSDLGAAASILESRFFKQPVKLSNLEKLACTHVWEDEYLRYTEIVGLQFDNHLISAPYIALACVTLRYQPELAYSFWYGVVTGETDSMTRPHAQLRRFILTTDRKSISNGGGGVAQKYRTATSINCWNHHYRSEAIKQLKTPDIANLKIEGTPY